MDEKLRYIGFLGLYHKQPQSRWLKTPEIYFLMVLEANLKSKCWMRNASSEGSGEESIFASSQFGGSLACPLACSCIFPISTSIITWPASLGLCLQMSLPFLLYRHWSLDLGLTLIQNDFILTWLHLPRSYFQGRSHPQVLKVRTKACLWGGHNPIHYTGDKWNVLANDREKQKQITAYKCATQLGLDIFLKN